MRFLTILATTTAAVAAGVSAAAAAANQPRCLSQGETFGVGQYACLKIGDRGKLALCETTPQEVMSWRTVQNHCPDEAAQVPQADGSEARCLANMRAFRAGRLACISVGDTRYLARCDMVLNASSWTRVQDDCPGDPLLDSGKAPDEGSWKSLTKPRQLLDRLLGRS